MNGKGGDVAQDPLLLDVHELKVGQDPWLMDVHEWKWRGSRTRSVIVGCALCMNGKGGEAGQDPWLLDAHESEVGPSQGLMDVHESNGRGSRTRSVVVRCPLCTNGKGGEAGQDPWLLDAHESEVGPSQWLMDVHESNGRGSRTRSVVVRCPLCMNGKGGEAGQDPWLLDAHESEVGPSQWLMDVHESNGRGSRTRSVVVRCPLCMNGKGGEVEKDARLLDVHYEWMEREGKEDKISDGWMCIVYKWNIAVI